MPDYVLGEFEQMLLLSILQLGEEAYGPTISPFLEESVGRSVSRGALYATLARLEEKGLVRWHLEPGTEERGGHRRRRFEVTRAGVTALRAYRRALTQLWAGLDHVLGSERQ